MPTLEWIGKSKVINHHQEVPFRVLERKYWCTAICAAFIPPESWSLHAPRISTLSGFFKERGCRTTLLLPDSGAERRKMQ